jgi:hypothetical protein
VARTSDPWRRGALALYGVLLTSPFAWAAATNDSFWTSVAPVATLLVLAVLVALLAGKRWAWVLLVALEALVGLSVLWGAVSVFIAAKAAVGLGLLLSPPVRRHVVA